MKRFIIPMASFVILLGSTSFSRVQAQNDFDPQKVDLAKLIECRADVRDYGALAFYLMDNAKAASQLGWKEVKQENSFIREYHLAKPVTVFGKSTQKIAFGSAGVLALFDKTNPEDLAKQLNLNLVGKTSENNQMYAKTIQENQQGNVVNKITLNVSTLASHPHKTLAGCEYRVEVK